MKTVDLADMRRHIKQLTAEFARDDVAIHRVKRLHRAKALKTESGEVLELQLPPVRSSISYATALHEIGHAKGRYQNSRSVMTRERAAWQWARENALIWTETMERRALNALAWYAKRVSPTAR
jgi:hypothetical protein